MPTTTRTGPVRTRSRRRCDNPRIRRDSHTTWTRARGLHNPIASQIDEWHDQLECWAGADRSSPYYRFSTVVGAVATALAGGALAGAKSVAGAAAVKAAPSGLDALSPTIRANVEDAIQRAAAGKIRFPNHDGKVFSNADGELPPGDYTEWTAAPNGAKRGVDRVIIEGDPANPIAIYYWDHVNPPVRIGP